MSVSLSKSVAITALMLSLFGGAAVYAGNDWTIKDGKGEEFSIKHGWFGKKQLKVQDRLGNKLESKKGLLGGKETQVEILGNQYKHKKGLWGGSQIEGRSILGDKITTKKGWFGRRKTTVEVSGVSAAIGSLLKGNKDGKELLPENDDAPGANQSSAPDLRN
jgi:hypothetical protein